MQGLIGDKNNKAREVSMRLLVGDKNNKARPVLKVLVGDKNNRARIVYLQDSQLPDTSIEGLFDNNNLLLKDLNDKTLVCAGGSADQITFYVDFGGSAPYDNQIQTYTTFNGATWQDFGTIYKEPDDFYIIGFENGFVYDASACVLGLNGRHVQTTDVIVPGATYRMLDAMTPQDLIRITIKNKIYTIPKYSTWEDILSTSLYGFKEDGYYINNDQIWNNKLGGVVVDSNGEEVWAYITIYEGNYYIKQYIATINFTLDNKVYTVPENTTWVELLNDLNSELSRDGYYLEDGNDLPFYVQNVNGGYIAVDNSGEFLDGRLEIGQDSIPTPNAIYYWQGKKGTIYIDDVPVVSAINTTWIWVTRVYYQNPEITFDYDDTYGENCLPVYKGKIIYNGDGTRPSYGDFINEGQRYYTDPYADPSGLYDSNNKQLTDNINKNLIPG